MVAVRHAALVVRRVVATLQQHRPGAGAAGQVLRPDQRPQGAHPGGPPLRPQLRVGIDPGQLEQAGREDRRGRGVPAGARRGVVPPRHAVGRCVRHREAGGPAGRVEQPLVVRLAVGRGEAVHRPGVPAGPGRLVGGALHRPAPGRQAGLLVEPHDVERAAVGADLPPRAGERVLHREVAPPGRSPEVGRLEQQLEVHQVVDVDGDLAGRAVPAADRGRRGHVAGGQRGGCATDDRGVLAATGESGAAPEAGLQHEPEVVGGGVVLAYDERRLPRRGPAGPRRSTVGLVGQPEPARARTRPATRRCRWCARADRAPPRSGTGRAGAGGRCGPAGAVRRCVPGGAGPRSGPRPGRSPRRPAPGPAAPSARPGPAALTPAGARQSVPHACRPDVTGAAPPDRSFVIGSAAARTRSTAPWWWRRRRRPTAPAGRRTPCRSRRRRGHRAP